MNKERIEHLRYYFGIDKAKGVAMFYSNRLGIDQCLSLMDSQAFKITMFIGYTIGTVIDTEFLIKDKSTPAMARLKTCKHADRLRKFMRLKKLEVNDFTFERPDGVCFDSGSIGEARVIIPLSLDYERIVLGFLRKLKVPVKVYPMLIHYSGSVLNVDKDYNLHSIEEILFDI